MFAIWNSKVLSFGYGFGRRASGGFRNGSAFVARGICFDHYGSWNVFDGEEI